MMENEILPPEETPQEMPETPEVEAKPRKNIFTTIIVVLFLCLGCIAGTLAGWYMGDYVIEWLTSF